MTALATALTSAGSPARLEAAMAGVLAVGHSSGPALALGALLAVHAWTLHSCVHA